MPASVSQASTAPGSSSRSKGKSKPKPPQKPPKVTTKSAADDIATRIHEDIAHNLYECPICTSELGKRSKIWSCELCWTVFHLSCVKKWSTNEGSAAARQPQDAEGSLAPKAWRCPGCNLSHEHFLLRILVGARKSLILGPCPVYLHTPVAKRAREPAEDVPTHATRLAMQALAHHVQQWARPRIVSVAVTPPRSAARIPIMKTVGAVEKYAVTFYHVENTPALSLVMKVFVALVRSRLMHVVTVAKSIQKCCAALGMRNSTVKRSKMD